MYESWMGRKRGCRPVSESQLALLRPNGNDSLRTLFQCTQEWLYRYHPGFIFLDLKRHCR
jgi:hypothetical protein